MTKTSPTESVTLRVPGDVLSDIEIIAKATDRSRSYVHRAGASDLSDE
ncbi:putative transcriptional regulator [Neorhizobium huautlense]|uniref:Transcriptional regulator n=1 Tax=Neorhizobium huautlense TaxID=67774 RepID=A0ABT9PUZ3_9HYPH|nr:hypothetical protein [Neorhizobium huautlense]MDP9838292.1 putative transcriptional regulator [Neorhizobium huautlense]